MKYVRIKAKNYNEAMLRLKMNYGEEAIPISHKYLKEGGLLKTKLFAQELVELTAAVKEEPSFKTEQDLLRTSNNLSEDDFFLSKEQTEEVQKSKSSSSHLEKEFEEIKKKLDQLISKNKEENQMVDSEIDNLAENNQWRTFFDLLQNNDFNWQECNLIVKEIKKNLTPEDFQDKVKIEKELKDFFKNKITTTGEILKGNNKKIIMFIGPTGVGKTTTMAKLGARFALQEGYQTTFITIDNYRLAATEQLKKYAEIMKIPAYAVNNRLDFKELIQREEADIILVDTSGRSHQDELKILEIKEFSDQIEYDFEKILCVSANTKKNDLNYIFQAFDKMDFDSVIITKVDETSFVGNVVDIADKYNKPIAYYTNGQEVPNDLVVAESNQIVDLMVGEHIF